MSTCLFSAIYAKGARFFNAGFIYRMFARVKCAMFDYKDYVCACLMFLLLAISLSFSYERVLRFRRSRKSSSISLSRALARKRPPRDTRTHAFPRLLPARVFASLHTNEHTHTHTLTYLLSSSRVITYSSFPTPRASSSSSATRATLSR